MYLCSCSYKNFLHTERDRVEHLDFHKNYFSLENTDVISYSVSTVCVFKQKTERSIHCVNYEHRTYVNNELLDICLTVAVTNEPNKERSDLESLSSVICVLTVPETQIDFLSFNTFIYAKTTEFDFLPSSRFSLFLACPYLVVANKGYKLSHSLQSESSTYLSRDLLVYSNENKGYTFSNSLQNESSTYLSRDLLVYSNENKGYTFSNSLQSESSTYLSRDLLVYSNENASLLSGTLVRWNLVLEEAALKVDIGCPSDSTSEILSKYNCAKRQRNGGIDKMNDEKETANSTDSVGNSPEIEPTELNVPSSQDFNSEATSKVKPDTVSSIDEDTTNIGATTSSDPPYGGLLPNNLDTQVLAAVNDSKRSESLGKIDYINMPDAIRKPSYDLSSYKFLKQMGISRKRIHNPSLDLDFDNNDENNTKTSSNTSATHPTYKSMMRSHENTANDASADESPDLNNKNHNIWSAYKMNANSLPNTVASGSKGSNESTHAATTTLNDGTIINVYTDDDDDDDFRSSVSPNSSSSENFSMIVDSTFLTPADKKLEEVRSPEEGLPGKTQVMPYGKCSLEITLQESLRLAMVDLGKLNPELLQHGKSTPTESDTTGSAFFDDTEVVIEPISTVIKKVSLETNDILIPSSLIPNRYIEIAKAYGYQSPHPSIMESGMSSVNESSTTLEIGEVQKTSSLKTLQRTSDSSNSKKGVRFADVMGLNLESVRHFRTTNSPPNIPSSAFNTLTVNQQSTSTEISSKYLVACFDQPGAKNDFIQNVRTQKLCIENIVTNDMTISGFIRVVSISYPKRVYVRYTTNAWASFCDVEAIYVENSRNILNERFSFVVVVSPLLEPETNLELAAFLTIDGLIYWDNNMGNNYLFQCFYKSSSIDSANT